MHLLSADARVYRMVAIGEGSVGKTSIISRLVGGTFGANTPRTVCANFRRMGIL
jgi:GTPase SAR1 family protein